LRYGLALNASQLDRQLLQPAQAALRLGQGVLPSAGAVHCHPIYRRYHFNSIGQKF